METNVKNLIRNLTLITLALSFNIASAEETSTPGAQPNVNALLFSQIHGFKGETVTLEASFMVPTSAKKAFYYFTPVGENEWLPYWVPVFPSGDPSPAVGKMFYTHEDNNGAKDIAIWMIADYDPEKHKIVYARLKPLDNTTLITVTIQQNDDNSSVATMRSDYTGISKKGNEFLAGLTEDQYAAWIKEYEVKLADHIRKN